MTNRNIKQCIHLDDLMKKQIPALIEAINHRKNLLESEKHMIVPYHMAEKDFINRFINTWAEGYKMCYCQNICKDKENCELSYKNLHQYTDYYKSN